MEKYIIGSNSSGKTRRMLEEAKNNNAVVVCRNPYAMKSKALGYGICNLEFVDYDDVNNNFIVGKKIAVDELGDFFEHYFGAKLDSFTMTID